MTNISQDATEKKTKTKKSRSKDSAGSNKPILRNPYSPRLESSRTRFHKPSLTKQSFKDECDINNIINRYAKTGHLSHVNNFPPQFGFAPAESFHEALILIEDAKENFQSLPSSIRKEFDNDPYAFLEFAENPENASQMAQMGFFSPDSPSHALLGSAEQTAEHATPEPEPEAPDTGD